MEIHGDILPQMENHGDFLYILVEQRAVVGVVDFVVFFHGDFFRLIEIHDDHDEADFVLRDFDAGFQGVDVGVTRFAIERAEIVQQDFLTVFRREGNLNHAFLALVDDVQVVHQAGGRAEAVTIVDPFPSDYADFSFFVGGDEPDTEAGRLLVVLPKGFCEGLEFSLVGDGELAFHELYLPSTLCNL